MKKYGFIMFLLVFATLFCSFALAKTVEMPNVVISGTPACLEFSKESIVFDTRTDNPGENIVQIGDIPIFSIEDLKNAYSLYDGQAVFVVSLENDRIKRDYRVINENDANFDTYSSSASSFGTISFFVPDINMGISVGHPIFNGKISGDIVKANVTEQNDEAIIMEKSNDDFFGKLESQNDYGVVFSYTSNIKATKKNNIKIANKNDVQIGNAYIYADTGKGKKKYEIEIVSLSSGENSDKISFMITDKRLKSRSINHPLKGMEGAPIIQNKKLVAIYGYTDGNLGYAVYAEDAYLSMLDYNNSKDETLSILTRNNHPLVYTGKFDVTLCLKKQGSINNKTSGYISMVDSTYYKFSMLTSSIDKECSFNSGLVVKGKFNLGENNSNTKNDVVGSISYMSKYLYGYISPYFFKTDEYTEIAFKEEVENGPAYISYYSSKDDYSQDYEIPIIVTKSEDHINLSLDNTNAPISSFDELPFVGMPIIQNGRMIGVYENARVGIYAIDVYNNMMNSNLKFN